MRPLPIAVAVVLAVGGTLLVLLGGGGATPTLSHETRADEPAPRYEHEVRVVPPSKGPRLVGILPTPAPAPTPVVEEPTRPRPEVPKSTWAQLAAAKGWLASCRAVCGLPARGDGAAMRNGLARLLEDESLGPVRRQHMLFHMALAVPVDEVFPWLSAASVRPTGSRWSEEDRTDALVAMAFAGEPTAVAAFERLAAHPAPADVHRLVPRIEDLDRIAAADTTDARRILRAYHALEVLDRRPYFRILSVLHAPIDWHAQGWPAVDAEMRVRLQEAWLRRYPGHPGSDDVALRIAREHLAAGRHVDAARWFAKATTLPDQDVTRSALAGVIALGELLLTPAELDRLAFVEGQASASHQLLLYIRARRIAAARGPQAGLDAFHEAVRSADVSTMARAWAARWRFPVPTGTRSGLRALRSDDPLLRTEKVPDLELGLADFRADEDLDPDPFETLWERRRLAPGREAQPLSMAVLANQLRAWETLAELRRRTAHARGSERADLLYKQAAILYHQRGVYFPAHARHSFSFRPLLAAPWQRDPENVASAIERFRRTSFAHDRALGLFAQIEREHPTWAGMDKVLFSRGLVWKALADYRPHLVWTGWRGQDDVRDEAIRQLVSAMEDCAARYPDSPLADDALRAAAHWRAQRPQAFGPAGR